MPVTNQWRSAVLTVAVLLSLNLTNSQAQSARLVINEFMAANKQTIADEKNEYDDWIEIYNASEDSIDLTGCYLTDNLNSPSKWPFPGGKIPARGYLLIWADGNTGQGKWHTNFKLDADGEQIGLYDGTHFVDSLSFPRQSADISYGRFPDGSNSWYFFSAATPGATNNTQQPRITETPIVTPASGFFQGPITITMQARTPGAIIHYSLNGAEPRADTLEYLQPIEIRKATVVRARAYAPGAEPSAIVSQSYLLNYRFQISTLSLVTDPYNLWDERYGIYVNPDERGDEWERPVTMEYFHEDGSFGFAENGGLRIHGKTAQTFAKKPFRLYFRSEYGDNWLRYGLFPQKSYLDSCKRLVVHSAGTDMPINPYSYGWTLIRDPLMHELTRRCGGIFVAIRPVALFLNGAAWGIYNLCERIDRYYLGSNFNEWDVDLVDNYGEAKEGDLQACNELIDFFKANDLSDADNFESAHRLMDVPNFTDYMILNIFSGNGDWKNNIVSYRPRRPDAVWRWIVWDMDGAFGPYGLFHNTLAEATGDHENALILKKLLENRGYRNFFINRFSDLLNTAFLPQQTRRLIDSLAAVINDDISFETNRWGSSPSEWLQDGIQGELYGFADDRPDVVRYHLQNQFDLAGTATLTIDRPIGGTGTIRVNSLLIENFPWQGIYFKGLPLEIEAFPHRGYEFRAWNDSTLPATDRVTLTLAKDYAVTAIFIVDPPVEHSVVINEINYQSAVDFDPEDWLELYNLSDRKLNMSGWHLKDSRDDHDFVIAEGTFIPAHGFLVICRNAAFFQSHFPLVKQFLGNLSFGLSRDGEVIRLFDANMKLVDSVRYNTHELWPVQANGEGATLELIEPTMDNSRAESWQASQGHGTPGRTNSAGWNAVAENARATVPPQRTMLNASYPNPFNGQTCICYQLAEATPVEIAIFNLLGHRIATLLAGQQAAGEYRLLFDGCDSEGQPLPSGIYLVRLKTNQLLESRKMVLIR